MEFQELVEKEDFEFEYIDPAYWDELKKSHHLAQGNGYKGDIEESLEEIGSGLLETEHYVEEVRNSFRSYPAAEQDELADTLQDMGSSLSRIHEEVPEDEIYSAALKSFSASVVAASFNTNEFSKLRDPVKIAWDVEGDLPDAFPDLMKKIGIPYNEERWGEIPI